MFEEISPQSRVSNWYSGQNVFITGATGFMGKVLVEKLLRSCPNIGKIYILIRPKRGKKPEERLATILNVPLFDLVRKENPNFAEKILTVIGDISQPGLGISAEDTTQLIENVSVVFHSAATVKFDEELKCAVELNVLSVQEMIKLCYQMKKLEAFVHVSSAYSNFNYSVVEEKMYPSPMDAQKLIQCVQCLNEDILNDITPKLLNGRPNTYTFTKAIAEHLIAEQQDKLPVAIFRPSVVVCSNKEPYAGWVDNLNGPTGFLVAGGKGIIRTMATKESIIMDLIPVDIAINCLICIAWDVAESKPKNVPIYNCTSGILNPIKMKEIIDWGLTYIREYPPSDCLWYPDGYASSHFAHKIRNFLLHIVPSYIFDMILVLLGRKPFIVKIQTKIQKAIKTVEFGIEKEWRFPSENLPKLLDKLTETDKTVFDFDVRKVNWNEFIKNFTIGVRTFLLKEDMSTLPKARANLKKLKIYHYSLKTAFFALLLMFFIRSTAIGYYLYQFLISSIYFMFNI